MKAVILSGGLGTRLKPFTEVIPKPLLPVGEKAVLEIQIENLSKHGFSEIFLATNYKSSYIEKFFGDGSQYGVKLIISKEKEPLGTAGPVRLVEQYLDEPFLVMNGDILTKLDFCSLYEFSCSKSSQLTVCTKEIVAPFQFGNIFTEGDLVTGIDEKPDIKTTILAGIYVFKPSLIKMIPPGVYYGMDSLIKDMLIKRCDITHYPVEEYWLDIGQIKDYDEAQKIYSKHFI